MPTTNEKYALKAIREPGTNNSRVVFEVSAERCKAYMKPLIVIEAPDKTIPLRALLYRATKTTFELSMVRNCVRQVNAM